MSQNGKWIFWSGFITSVISAWIVGSLVGGLFPICERVHSFSQVECRSNSEVSWAVGVVVFSITIGLFTLVAIAATVEERLRHIESEMLVLVGTALNRDGEMD